MWTDESKNQLARCADGCRASRRGARLTATVSRPRAMLALSALLGFLLLAPACASGVVGGQPCDCITCGDESCSGGSDGGDSQMSESDGSVGDSDSIAGEDQDGDGDAGADGDHGADGDGDSEGTPIYDPLDGIAPTRGAFSSPSLTPRILIVDTLSPDVSGSETTGRGTLRWAYTRPYPRVRAGKTVNSPEALPARAMCVAYTKLTGDCTSHSMQDGFDWSGAAATTISVDGATINLDQNCTTGTTADERFTCVAGMLSAQLPTDLEVFRVFGPGYFIGIRTKAKGATESLTVSGPGLVDLGIPAATYVGSDATGVLPAAQATRAVDNLPGYPAAPFADDDQDGFSNLEEFLAGLARQLVL